jgi:hypothetical protein
MAKFKSKKEARLSSILEASGVEGGGSALQRGAARLTQSLGAGGAILGGGGKISGLMGALMRGVVKHPILSTIDAVGLGLPLLGLAKDAANVVSRSVTGDPLIGGISTDQALEMEREVQKEQRRREIENQARAQRFAQNTVSLIQNAPSVAQQIMAGRRLPKGAVVIGGTPRIDLMQQMAEQMSDGAFQDQDPLQQLTTET